MTDLPQAVQDAANRLMGALALHEDTRDTLETALAALWNTGRSELADTLRAIRGDARALRDGTALTRTAPAGRIITRVDQLLQALGQNTSSDEQEQAS